MHRSIETVIYINSRVEKSFSVKDPLLSKKLYNGYKTNYHSNISQLSIYVMVFSKLCFLFLCIICTF